MDNPTPRTLSSLFGLEAKAAFVPGGYGGIGEAIAWAMAQAGARVAVAGRDGDKAEALAASLRAAGHDALGLAMDAHSVAATQEAVDAAARHFGRLDILMNCIGIQREQSLLEVTEEAFDEVTQVNLKAAMFLAQAAARHQIAGGRGGAQVHLLSVRSRFGLRGRGYSAYASTKGALVMLIRQHAAELAPHGITVNGIAPTVVRTGMARHWLDNPATHEQLLARIPLGRVAEPADIAGTAVYFCAPAAAYVTGQVLYLDGGITATQ
ncbi:SDR family NAD(P)-dependent oxidoreductase [Variovorax saccharolyticus]|uniref:SDR family NAD(P)-dependent oxidoreductase n=1 Tax=Variovorax saccharolyticus TaxID=3053516 RepID=UPI002576BFFF|nr:SDR family oxidoreductase [Variovorax sp. J22R187]MDM0020181.1 SDR family oxidoreductase [Variovorax sp. J22R187]